MNERDYDELDPPSDITAERYTLAAMMTHPSAVETAVGVLEPEAFYRPAHQEIFRALVIMMANGEVADPITLRKAMIDAGNVKTLGTNPMLLADLYGMPVIPGNVADYAQVVRHTFVRRRMLEMGDRLMREARHDDVDDAVVVTRGQAMLDSLLTHGGGAASIMPTLTVDEVCDADDVEVTQLIPGLLNSMERVVVVGPEGAGKSILSLQLAFAVAAGVHPFSTSTPIEPSNVMVADLENPPHIVQRRLRTFRTIAQQVPTWDGKRLTIMQRPGGINVTNQRDAYALAKQVKDSGARLLVIGPIYKMLSGCDLTLDNYARAAAFLDQLREDCGVALWIEAHAPFGAGGKARDMRPEGSNVWMKWPEFGVALQWAKKNHDGDFGGLDWTDFRGQREEGRAWPSWISRNRNPGSGWPWIANYERAGAVQARPGLGRPGQLLLPPAPDAR